LFNVLIDKVLLHTLLEIPTQDIGQRRNTNLIFTHTDILNSNFHLCVQIHGF